MRDLQRIKALTKILSEDVVRSLSLQLADGRISYALNQKLFQYENYSNNTLSTFSNQKLNNAYQKFNKHFQALHSFIRRHFFLDAIHGNYELYRDKRKNPDELKEWHKYYNQLNSLAESFESEYKNLLKTCISVEPKLLRKAEGHTKAYAQIFNLSTGELVYKNKVVKFDSDKKPYLFLKLLSSNVKHLFKYAEIKQYFLDHGVKTDKYDIANIARQIRNTLKRNGLKSAPLFCNKGYQLVE